jgi:hypothetical protein
MWKGVVGLAALLAVAWSAPAMAQAEPDGFQQDDQPGSEIDIDIGGGDGVQIERQDGQPLFGAGETQPEEDADADDDDPLDDPDNPSDVDSTDEELPGEGPENLSGPDDMDGLPD